MSEKSLSALQHPYLGYNRTPNPVREVRFFLDVFGDETVSTGQAEVGRQKRLQAKADNFLKVCSGHRCKSGHLHT